MMSNGKKETESEETLKAAVELKWFIPEDIRTIYSNHVIVQKSEHECFFLFFEVNPPLFLGTPEEIQEQAKSLDHVQAKCVARLAVSKELAAKIAKSIQTVSDVPADK
jgi:hypothetical protein